MIKKHHKSEYKTNLITDQRGGKSKVVAGLLAIFLGGIGIHKFYLGKVGWGVIYLLFAWTGIPIFLGLFEGVNYLLMSDNSFNSKYN